MTQPLSREFELWRLADRARSGEASADEAPRLAALAVATVAAMAPAGARRDMCRHRLLRLADLIAPGVGSRAAQRATSIALARYRRAMWTTDRQAGFYAGNDSVRSLCCEIMQLSAGKLSDRKLQEIFSSAQKRA